MPSDYSEIYFISGNLLRSIWNFETLKENEKVSWDKSGGL